MKNLYEIGKVVAKQKFQELTARSFSFDTSLCTFSDIWLDGTTIVKSVDYELPDDIAFGPVGIKLLQVDKARPEIVASDYICNMSELEQSISSTLSGSITTEESWNISESVETGIEAELNIACLIADSNIKTHINKSITKEHSWGKETSTSWEKSLTMNIPAKSAGKCSLITYKRELELPFTITLELQGKLITRIKFPVWEPNTTGETVYSEEENHFSLDGYSIEERTIEIKGTWKGIGCFGGHILFESV